MMARKYPLHTLSTPTRCATVPYSSSPPPPEKGSQVTVPQGRGGGHGTCNVPDRSRNMRHPPITRIVTIITTFDTTAVSGRILRI